VVKEKLLFENWRKYLKEGQDLDFALYADMKKEMGMIRPHFFLYDYQKLLSSFKEHSKLLSDRAFLYNSEISLGMIILASTEDMGHGPCWNSYEIIRSAVHKNFQGRGFGKLMYQLAMSFVWDKAQVGVTSDRSSVSQDARRIWNGMDKYSDKIKPFDDILNPKTPPPEDDCKFPSKGSGEESAPGSYKLTDEIIAQRISQIKQMASKHIEVLEFFQENKGYTSEVTEKYISEAMYDLFSRVH